MHNLDAANKEFVQKNVSRIIISRDRIAARVKELARDISHCYKDNEVMILPVLTGSVIFLADLIRHLPLMMRIDVVSVSSYPGASTVSQGPKFKIPLLETVGIVGRDILIVDDILDSGATLGALVDFVSARKPARVRTCVLLKKQRPDLPERMDADFIGFDIENEFVVGYGLDFNNLYRNLPDVCVPDRKIIGGRQ